MKTGMFMQALCKVAVSVLPEHIIGMDIGSDWGMFPLPGIKQKAHKSTLQAILIAKCEAVKMSEPTEYKIEA